MAEIGYSEEDLEQNRRCPHILERRNRAPSYRTASPSDCLLCALALEVYGNDARKYHLREEEDDPHLSYHRAVAGYRHIRDGIRAGDIEMLTKWTITLAMDYPDPGQTASWFDRELED